MYAKFASIGAYVPERVMTNKDFEKIVDTTDEWITKRTGIKTRHFADESQATSDLALEAAKIAIKRAELLPEQIDLIILATFSPDYPAMPSTACVLGNKLGLKNIPAFDISAACTGFVYGLATAKAYVESGMAKNVLVVGAEVLSRLLNFEDRGTCVLFGDGAGAAIIQPTDKKEEAIKDIHISSDGSFGDLLYIPSGGSVNNFSQKVLDEKSHLITMKGNETFKVAVRTLSKDVVDILAKNEMDSDEIKFFIPHQANYRIIKAVGDSIGMKEEQVVLTVGKYGNTSAASIPMAINEIYENGSLQNGDMMLLDAFGGGFTWGSALVPFGGIGK